MDKLRNAVRQALNHVMSQEDVEDAFIFASANRRTIARIAYTTHLGMASEGVLEPKTNDDSGISLYVVFKEGTAGKRLTGFGHENSDISSAAVRNSLERARAGAYYDPYFYSLPNLKDIGDIKAKTPKGYHDEGFMELNEEEEARFVTRSGWEAIHGALTRVQRWCQREGLSAEEIEFILSGDVFLLREQIAIASTTGIGETDETTIFSTYLSAMIESGNTKGSGVDASMHLWDFRPFRSGYRAAENAIKGIEGIRVPSGKYNVIFGPQAVVDLFHILAVSFSLDVLEAGGGIFLGKYGEQVATPLLSIYDDGSLQGGAGTKRVTCDGYPTRRLDLIKDGKLVGYLTNDYTSKRILHIADTAEITKRLGIAPSAIKNVLVPAANGFRFGYGGGRIASSLPGVCCTNVVIESSKDLTQAELLKRVEDGLFIGRLWYTYPSGGYSTGEFSSTVVADSFIIKDGEISTPLSPNTLRINDNIKRILFDIIGVTKYRVPAVEWMSDEILYAPWVAVAGVNMIEIGKSLEE